MLAGCIGVVNASLGAFASARHPCFGSEMRVPLLDPSAQYERLAEPIRREFDGTLRTHRSLPGP